MKIHCSHRFCVVLSLIAFCSSGAFAQRFSFGVIGGGALTNDFNAQTADYSSLGPGLPVYAIRSYPTSKAYVIGPMIRFSLPAGFAVEVNALYRPLHFASATLLPDGTLATISPATVITWEFPVLAEYRFKELGLPVRPMLQAGPSFRSSGNNNGTNPSTHGITAGAGIEFGLWKLSLAPQLRYTRWAPDPQPSGARPSTRLDQLELLLSVSWGH